MGSDILKQKILTFSPLSDAECQKLVPETSPEKMFQNGKAHHEEAFRLFQKAAEQGSAEAQAYVNFYQMMEKKIQKEKNNPPHMKQNAGQKKIPITETLKNAKINDIIRFGNYDWYIISKSSDRCTLFCKDIVSQKAYHEKTETVIWKNCTLRRWLNHEFYDEFTSEEKALITKTSHRIKNSNEEIQDDIYLLSIEETEKLTRKIRSCSAWWWLRSSGDTLQLAALIYSMGNSSKHGYVVSEVNGVRPALTLKF